MRFLKHPFGEGRAAAVSLTALPRHGAGASAPVVPRNEGVVSDSIAAQASPVVDDARLRIALWGADMGLWELDLRTDTTRWLDDWCARLELDPCEGADHIARWDANVHPDDRCEAAARLIAHLAGATDHYEAEYRIANRKGRWLWLTERGQVVQRDASSAPLKLVVSCKEIGARKKSEETLRLSKLSEVALHESRTTLLTIAESSADVLALFDRRRQCVFLNRPIPGLTPDPWLGAPVEEFAPLEDRPRVHEIFERVIQSGAPHDFEQLFTDSRRRLRCMEMRVRAVQSGEQVLGAVANITEVTEQRAQRDTLRTQARILETMREGVVLVDAASTLIRLTNPTFDRLFGYRHGSLIGQSVEPLLSLPGSYRKRFERGLRDHSRIGSVPVEFECIRQDGGRFVASCVLSPLSMGGTDHWLAVVNDVTERKRLERSIIDIANREQQRIGSDLHDGLGQELTGIALMLRGVSAQLNREKSGARLDVEDIIGLVNNAIENTRSLARGLSPVSAERGGLIAALRTLAGRACERYGVHVEFRDKVTIPLHLNDDFATHLYRIAQEALTNVVRHSLASDVTICLEVIGEELHLRIDDNGRGFAHQPAQGEVGLGLKLMRYRVQMLGGDIVLETSANGGASVRCTCPLER